MLKSLLYLTILIVKGLEDEIIDENRFHHIQILIHSRVTVNKYCEEDEYEDDIANNNDRKRKRRDESSVCTKRIRRRFKVEPKF